jgi:hypothetical protein
VCHLHEPVCSLPLIATPCGTGNTLSTVNEGRRREKQHDLISGYGCQKLTSTSCSSHDWEEADIQVGYGKSISDAETRLTARFSPSKSGFTRNSSVLLCHNWSTRPFPPLHRVPPSARTVLSPFAGRRRKLRLLPQRRCRDDQLPAHRAEQPSTLRARERQTSRRPRHNLGPERRPKRPRKPSARPQKPLLLLVPRRVQVVRLLNLLRRRRLASAHHPQ